MNELMLWLGIIMIAIGFFALGFLIHAIIVEPTWSPKWFRKTD
jgi:hypothetical protein